MAIYTKTGDKGETGLFGGKRLSKDDVQVAAYGNVDELTSFVGLLSAKVIRKTDKDFLLGIQKDLYLIMGFLANAPTKVDVLSDRTKELEKNIDEMEEQLPQLTTFILPSGSELSALAHVCRTVCRRVERSIVTLSKNTHLDDTSMSLIKKYLNRLSDLFFDLARFYNKENEITISLLKK